MRNIFNKRLLLSVFIVIFGLTACNLPSAEQLPPPSDVQTAAALTVEAKLLHQMASATLPAPPVTDTPQPTFAPTGTITPTYSVPMLRILEQTNCRTGPGQDYDVVHIYLPENELEILGSYADETYWLIRSEQSQTGECWLWGEFVEVSGSYWAVPTLTRPPTKTPAPPDAPTVQKWDFFCNAVTGNMDVTIEWKDNANNESGYRVVRANTVAIELPPNSFTFTEIIPLGPGESITYFIEVYNVTDTLRSTPITLTC
jgi:hypothetical protein